jgi:hypothetical protein
MKQNGTLMNAHCNSTIKIAFIAACAFAIALPLFAANTATAQTGANLVLLPWENDAQQGQLAHSYSAFGSGHSNGPSATNNFDLQLFETTGRAHVGNDHTLQAPGAFNIGFTQVHLDIDTNDPLLPTRLSDTQFAIGKHLFKKGDWDVSAVVGIGFSSSNAYGDSQGHYGRADLIFSKQIDQRSNLTLIANYDGNRSIYPDIPLPAIAYTRQQTDKFQFTVGFPWNRLVWKPKPDVTVKAGFAFPTTFIASTEYQVKSDLQVFLALRNHFNAYHVAGDLEHRRLFFRQRKVETGMNWTPKKNVTLTAAVGYAFDQKFTRGWDVRDTDTIRKISDEPFVRFGLNLEF